MENIKTKTDAIIVHQGDGKHAELLAKDLCPYCHCAMTFVEVHGHYQCNTCKSVVIPCCTGETYG